MQISLESIQEVEDPYQAFVDSIKSPDTFRKYKNHLHRFLKLIPSKVYVDSLGKEPENDSIEELSKLFVMLGQKDLKICMDKKTKGKILKARTPNKARVCFW